MTQRLIDADAIRYEPMLSARGNGNYEDIMVAYKDQIDDIPTIEERKTGKWIRMPMACYGGGTITEYECSECSEHQIIESKWCPNCGADMRGEQ